MSFSWLRASSSGASHELSAKIKEEETELQEDFPADQMQPLALKFL